MGSLAQRRGSKQIQHRLVTRRPGLPIGRILVECIPHLFSEPVIRWRWRRLVRRLPRIFALSFIRIALKRSLARWLQCPQSPLIEGLKSLCFERARLQPRRTRPLHNVALATEGILPATAIVPIANTIGKFALIAATNPSLSRMRLDIVPQRKIGVHSLLYSVIHHPQPARRRLLLLRHAQQVAGLHNNLKRIAQLMCQLANLDRNIFGDTFGISRRLWFVRRVCHHWVISYISKVDVLERR
jgi:hypothetical protein